MKIGLISVDGKKKFPNLALMKLSAAHKSIGDRVEWYNNLEYYDIVYKSKIFTFTPDYQYYINAKQVISGGTGYLDFIKLPIETDIFKPDLSLYPNFEHALGFITRGCIRNCSWCIVPKKEGNIRPNSDINYILQDRKSAVLLDNNVLACDYGIRQIEKIIDLDVRVDFNQGLDARLVTPEIAKLLSRVKWIDNTIRFSCDTRAVFDSIVAAKALLTAYGYKGKIFVYVLLTEDINECLSRIMDLDFLDFKENGKRNYKIISFAQPYIDYSSKKNIPMWQQDMARWCNKKELFYKIPFKDYKPRKGFKCDYYFK